MGETNPTPCLNGLGKTLHTQLTVSLQSTKWSRVGRKWLYMYKKGVFYFCPLKIDMSVDKDTECQSWYQIRKGSIKGLKNEKAKWHRKIYLTGLLPNYIHQATWQNMLPTCIDIMQWNTMVDQIWLISGKTIVMNYTWISHTADLLTHVAMKYGRSNVADDARKGIILNFNHELSAIDRSCQKSVTVVSVLNYICRAT